MSGAALGAALYLHLTGLGLTLVAESGASKLLRDAKAQRARTRSYLHPLG